MPCLGLWISFGTACVFRSRRDHGGGAGVFYASDRAQSSAANTACIAALFAFRHSCFLSLSSDADTIAGVKKAEYREKADMKTMRADARRISSLHPIYKHTIRWPSIYKKIRFRGDLRTFQVFSGIHEIFESISYYLTVIWTALRRHFDC